MNSKIQPIYSQYTNVNKYHTRIGRGKAVEKGLKRAIQKQTRLEKEESNAIQPILFIHNHA